MESVKEKAINKFDKFMNSLTIEEREEVWIMLYRHIMETKGL